VLEAVTAAVRRTQQLGAPKPVLRVALKADYDAGLLPRIVATYRAGDHVVPVELILGGRGEQLPALREGRADVAVVPVPFDNRGLDVESLVSEPRVVALAATDPLATRDVLRLSDLAGRVLPDGTPAERGGLQRPRSQRYDGPRLDLAEIFNLVELGKVVYFPPVSMARRYRRPDVVYRPVYDLLPFTLAIAWPQDSRSRAVAAFVRAATSVAAATDPRPGSSI
jgi:DNA-binding transcriptional LysR family regulator